MINKFGLCAAYENGYKLCKYAVKSPYKIDFISTYDKDKSKFRLEIEEIARNNNIKLLKGIDANSIIFRNYLKERDIDLIFLCWWPQLIKRNALNSVNVGWINLHPSLLPFGRGKHAYFWSIVEDYAYGATLHFIDEGIDTGPILFQVKLDKKITDTGESLYRKSVNLSIKLFKENYEKIINGNYSLKEQILTEGTMRLSTEIEEITRIDLKKTYNALNLIDIMRARTFENGPSAYFYKDEKKYYIKVRIEEAK